MLPVAIWGTEQVKLPRDLIRSTRVQVSVGKPFTLQKADRLTKDQVAAGTREIMMRIAELLPAEYRGIYKDVNAAAARETS